MKSVNSVFCFCPSGFWLSSHPVQFFTHEVFSFIYFRFFLEIECAGHEAPRTRGASNGIDRCRHTKIELDDELMVDIEDGLASSATIILRVEIDLVIQQVVLVLEPFKDSISQQISRAQQFFFSSASISNIDHLILAGGCSSIDGIAELVEAKIGVPTIVANPFADMSVSSRVSIQTLNNDAPALMVSCGLALRSFD